MDILKLKSFDINMVKEKRAKKLVLAFPIE